MLTLNADIITDLYILYRRLRPIASLCIVIYDLKSLFFVLQGLLLLNPLASLHGLLFLIISQEYLYAQFHRQDSIYRGLYTLDVGYWLERILAQ